MAMQERMLLPFGPWMLLPSVLALVAFIFSTAASFDCSFFHVTKQRSEARVGYGLDHTHTATIKVGIWTVEEDWGYDAPETDWESEYVGAWSTIDEAWREGSPTCVAWFNSKLGKLPDKSVKIARVFTLLVVVGGAFLLVLMFAHALWKPLFCVSDKLLDGAVLPTRHNWPTLRVSSVATAGCVLFGFYTLLFTSVLGTKACSEERVDRCRLAASGYLCICSTLLWWAAAVAMWWWGPGGRRRETTTASEDTTKPPTLKDIEELEATEQMDEENNNATSSLEEE